MLERRWEVRLMHTLREGNSCADFMAKAGADQQALFELVHDPPAGLRPLLFADAVGTSFPRP